MKIKIMLASFVLGGLITLPAAYNADFTPVSITEWLINGLFAAAFLSFIGIKLFAKEVDRPIQVTKKKGKRK